MRNLRLSLLSKIILTIPILIVAIYCSRTSNGGVTLQDGQAFVITFGTNGGANIESQTIRLNDTVVKPNNPAKDGFVFEGWYSDSELTEEYIFSTLVTQNVMLYARWVPKKTTSAVIFNSNGGTQVNPLNLEKNEVFIKPENPFREGYKFGGWFSDANLQVPYIFSDQPINEDISLYAKWDRFFVIAFDSKEGSAVRSMIVDSNMVPSRPEDPARSGYFFDGWYQDETFENQYSFAFPVRNEFTLYAKWDVDLASILTVSFDLNYDDKISTREVFHNTVMLEPSPPTRPGYFFKGWFLDDIIFIEEYDFANQVTQDITLYAKWDIKKYTLAFNTNDPNVSVLARVVDSNTLATAPPPPIRTGYEFDGWYQDNNTFNVPYTFNTSVLSDIQLYAKWEAINYTIRFDTDGGTSISDQSKTSGELVTRPADPTIRIPGVIGFDGWFTDQIFLIRAYDFTTPVSADLTLYARWAYRVTYDLENREITGLNPDITGNNINLISLPTEINGIKISKIGDRAFADSIRVKSVTFGDGIREIGDEAFSNSGLMGSITIPETINSIGVRAFAGLNNVTSFVFESETPPIFEPFIFENINVLVISVPMSAVNAYKNSPNLARYKDAIKGR